MEFFQPSLVVGISDMLPPDGDIERVRAISEDVANSEIQSMDPSSFSYD